MHKKSNLSIFLLIIFYSLSGCVTQPIPYPLLAEKEKNTLDECKSLLFTNTDRELYHQTLPILQQGEQLITDNKLQEAKSLLQEWVDKNQNEILSQCYKTLQKWEDFYIFRYEIKENITALKWVTDKKNLLIIQHQSGKLLFFPSIQFSHIEQKQQTTAQSLIQLTEQALEKNQLFLAKEALSALDEAKLDNSLIQQVNLMRAKIPETQDSRWSVWPISDSTFDAECALNHFLEQIRLTPPPKIEKKALLEVNETDEKQDALTLHALMIALDEAIQKGDLILIHQLLGKIEFFEPLPIEVSLKIVTMRHFLKSEIQTLDKQANNFYRLGEIEKAQNIWKFLLDLSDNEQIKEKFDRSNKVIQNVEKLRGR